MSLKLLVMGLFLFFFGLAASGPHPCSRPCEKGAAPMTCHYNLTAEWYMTLSKACWECPFNLTDCFRPQCVSGDGKIRPIQTFNRQIPGPVIEVCEGDTVSVLVTNSLSDGGTVSVHWHGMHQRGTPYMDGVPQITQCPISPRQSHRYEFRASPAGTHWYHSHTGVQLADGMSGPLIVRRFPESEPQFSLYDFDLSEHVMFIADWLTEPTHNRFTGILNIGETDVPWSALINGRNRFFPVQSPEDAPTVLTPVSTFRVTQGFRYRFRLINGGQECDFKVNFDQHAMQVIASDGHSLTPVTVDTLTITPGERYDIVVSADQAVGQYWIRAQGGGECQESEGAPGSAYAVLTYTNTSQDQPSGDPLVFNYGTVLHPSKTTDSKYQKVSLTQLNYTEEDVDLTDHPADVTHYISMAQMESESTVMNHDSLYPLRGLPEYRSHESPVMNNISFLSPPVPLLTQPEDVEEGWFCNSSTLNTQLCPQDICLCTHRILVEPDQMVELVVAVAGGAEAQGHPVHLHGYSFHVLAVEKYNSSWTLKHVQEMDRQGLVPRKLINPVLKDTIYIPPRHYAVVRFRANNPGIWFFHCHMDDHLNQGKALIIQDGNHAQFPPLPDDVPRCGGHGTSNARRTVTPDPPKCDTNSASATTKLICLTWLWTLLLLREFWA